MASPLQDLDELTLKCRNEKAKLFIGEAVAAYRAGAYRACIVACWVAVCFDVMEKLREMALDGVDEAAKKVQELDRISQSDDLTASLKFERELLSLASTRFELLSPSEVIDLERLKQDRNRCAHPTLNAENEPYSPPAELARLHIHSVVTHLLQHPPVQGKEALIRLLRDVDSNLFPTTKEQALHALSSGLLKKPRSSLVTNFATVLGKEILKPSTDNARRQRLLAALLATRELHRDTVDSVLKKNLSALCRSLVDGDLHFMTMVLKTVSDSWQFLEADVRIRLENYVQHLPASRFEDLEFLLKFEPLQGKAKTRTSIATVQELAGIAFGSTPPEVISHLITIHLRARTLEQADAAAEQLIYKFDGFNTELGRKLIQSVGLKHRGPNSVLIHQLFAMFQDIELLPPGEMADLFKKHNLPYQATGA